MNKFIALIAGLVAFVAIAQVAQALGKDDTLINEIPQGEDIDDELEGGLGDITGILKTNAKKVVGVSAQQEWGYDPLGKGLHKFAHERTQECKGSKNKEQCETCCNGNQKAAQFKGGFGNLLSKNGCTCFDRDNSYANNI